MKLLNLSLSLDEVNVILESLGQMPYIKVSNLINKIQQQSIDQLQKNESLHEVRDYGGSGQVSEAKKHNTIEKKETA